MCLVPFSQQRVFFDDAEFQNTAMQRGSPFQRVMQQQITDAAVSVCRQNTETAQFAFRMFPAQKIVVSDRLTVFKKTVHRAVLFLHPVQQLRFIRCKCRKPRRILRGQSECICNRLKAAADYLHTGRDLIPADCFYHSVSPAASVFFILHKRHARIDNLRRAGAVIAHFLIQMTVSGLLQDR